jgi:anti-sigma28 factor (negative regulator of flagellin synthesis)
MMTTEIVNEIAHLMRQRDLSLKDPKEVKAQKSVLDTPQDEVELTKTGEFYANPVSTSNEYEKDQYMKVERLKSLVQSGNYKMDKDMVNNIAENIAKMFL